MYTQDTSSFIGKTIVNVDNNACDSWIFTFSDGSCVVVEANVLTHSGVVLLEVHVPSETKD